MEVWGYALASVVGLSLVSLIGVFTLSLSVARLQRVMFLLVSFAVGAMLSGALVHLIPEASEQIGGELTGILVLVGVLLFFVLEKVLHWRHSHDVVPGEMPQSHGHHHGHSHGHSHAHSHSGPKTFATMNLVGDAAHNLIDGMVIAAAYVVSIPTGLVTTFAVALHEIPQEIGDFGVLVYGGYEPRRALLYNFISSLFAVAGAIIALTLGAFVDDFAAYLLPITAGSFIYVAGSDLIPELHVNHSRPAVKSVWQFVMIVPGHERDVSARAVLGRYQIRKLSAGLR